MPHKRAKRSTREETRKQKSVGMRNPLPFSSHTYTDTRGANLAPSKSDGISNESIPKSAMRVLQAAQIRAEHAKRKREDPNDDDGGRGKRRRQDGGVEKGKGKAKEDEEDEDEAADAVAPLQYIVTTIRRRIALHSVSLPARQFPIGRSGSCRFRPEEADGD